jgi:hypothetical protein
MSNSTGHVDCNRLRGDERGRHASMAPEVCQSRWPALLDWNSQSACHVCVGREAHETGRWAMCGGAQVSKNTQKIYKKFPKSFQFGRPRARGFRSFQNVSKKFPSRVRWTRSETAKEMVVEHKGNALRRSCFLDLCAWISVASDAVRFRRRVLRLQCAQRRPADGRFFGARPKTLLPSTQYLGALSDSNPIGGEPC